MSTNPFRRSSLRGPGGSNSTYLPTALADAGTTDQDDRNAGSLSIDTKAPSSTQKHVNFASPPAVPISPISYPPSSPESLRISPAFSSAQPVLSAPTDYSEAIQADPFQAGAETDEDDGAIEQALRNAKTNTQILSLDPAREREDAVKKTLSKFATAPKRPIGARDESKSTGHTNRNTMDVDAFKRLLLTGKSDAEHIDSESTSAPATPRSVGNSTTFSHASRIAAPQSTVADSGEIWHPSGTMPSLVSFDRNVDAGKKKPPPPRSRHGKVIGDEALPVSADHEQNTTPDPSVTNTSSQELSAGPVAIGSPKRAPPPPLSRRRSQNSGIVRSSSLRQSSTNDQEPHDASAHSSKAPPPPPSRRPNSTLDRRPSSELPPTAEESDTSDDSVSSTPPPASIKSPSSTLRSSIASKRMSTGPVNPPPLPPPRRGRGSSRSSIDSQRPALSALSGNVNSTRSSGEYARTEADSRKTSTASNANDILADLAALQQEVDNARRGALQP